MSTGFSYNNKGLSNVFGQLNNPKITLLFLDTLHNGFNHLKLGLKKKNAKVSKRPNGPIFLPFVWNYMSPEILGSIVAGEHCRDVNLLRDGFYRQIRVKTIDNTHIYCI